MISELPSALSLSASGLYVFVIMACILAARAARTGSHCAWHARSWFALGGFFTLLIAMRLTLFEDVVRMHLRDILRAQDAYGLRRDIQWVIVVFLSSVGGALSVWWGYRAFTSSRRWRDVAVKIANAAGLGLVALVALRLVSLHAIDRLLYGPLKLNWIGDIGASLVVLCAAFFYLRRTQMVRLAQQR